MVTKMHRRDPLSNLPLFSSCTPHQVAQVRSLMTQLTVPAGTVLIHEGSFGYEFLIIASGVAQVTAGGEDVATLRAGDFAGEMSLLDRQRRSATVTSLTPLTFYVCNIGEFAGLLEAAPSVAEAVTRAASMREQANRVRAA